MVKLSESSPNLVAVLVVVVLVATGLRGAFLALEHDAVAVNLEVRVLQRSEGLVGNRKAPPAPAPPELAISSCQSGGPSASSIGGSEGRALALRGDLVGADEIVKAPGQPSPAMSSRRSRRRTRRTRRNRQSRSPAA